MTDPAVEAAKRAVPTPPPNWMLDDHVMDELGAYGTAAAREALEPIREEYQELIREAGRPDDDRSIGMWRVLDAFAPLIYPSEELERWAVTAISIGLPAYPIRQARMTTIACGLPITTAGTSVSAEIRGSADE